jgi:hypothetical protein
MAENHLVAVHCKLRKSAFADERVFRVTLANGEEYRGVAPRYFCWNAQGQLIGDDEPAQESDGLLAARIAYTLGGDQVAVEVPDGEILAVRRASVTARPTEIRPHVPV